MKTIIPQHPHGRSQLSVALGLGDPMPSSGLCGHFVNIWHRQDMYTNTTIIYIKEKDKEKFENY